MLPVNPNSNNTAKPETEMNGASSSSRASSSSSSMSSNSNEPAAQPEPSPSSSSSSVSSTTKAKPGTFASSLNGVMTTTTGWDPTRSKKTKSQTLTTEVRRRVQSEILNSMKNPIEGIYLVPDEEDMSNFHAIVLGPKGTPYAGGLFYFFIKIPADYPWKPPQVKLMTTCNGTVRFNPNLYASGKVCLSILGTWAGPSWTPSLTLQSVLLSIQSLMNEEPFYNEPFYEGKQKYRNTRKMAEEYSEDIRFHTIRVAVLDMVEGTNGDTQNLPDVLRERVVNLFHENYSNYLHTITVNTGSSSKYGYAALKTRLVEVKTKLDKQAIKKPK